MTDAPEKIFEEWFVRNYPGPDTIIGNPHWHAPKIFRAAMYANKDNERAAYLRGLEDAANVAENFGADQMCVKCSHPRSNHPFRHPFQSGPGDPLNVADAIRALAKEKRK